MIPALHTHARYFSPVSAFGLTQDFTKETAIPPISHLPKRANADCTSRAFVPFQLEHRSTPGPRIN